jgi:CubicO group peptidase (beta-lactamase class C family)
MHQFEDVRKKFHHCLSRQIILSALLSLAATTPPAVADTRSADAAIETVKTKAISKNLVQKLDSLVDSSCRSLHEVGYAVAVVDHGQIIYEKCYGDAQKLTPVTPQTIFGLASITKTFTALNLLSLVDQGKINLDDSITKYLPEAPFNWKNISIRQLAAMTAGFPRDLVPEAQWRNGGYEQAKAMTLLTAPGAQFLYSNVGYRILGQLIENVTASSLLELNRELIISPAHMTSTGVVTEFRDSPLLATPFVNKDGELKAVKYRTPDLNFASGNLFSTVEDMSRYAAMLLDQKFVSKQAYQTMWYERPTLTDGSPSYWAFGWRAATTGDKTAIKKMTMNGGLPGIASTIILYPNKKIGVVSLSNFRTKSGAKIADHPSTLGLSDRSDQSLTLRERDRSLIFD